MASNLDKTKLYPYLQSFGYSEQAINQALRKAPIEYQGALRKAYGKDFKDIRNTELSKKDKDYLNGKVLKWLTNELDKTMQFTKEDSKLFNHLIKAASIKSWDEVAYLLKFGYINNKKFSIQRIYEIINNTKDNKERISQERLKEILGDCKKKEKFIIRMDRVIQNEKLTQAKNIINNLTKEQEESKSISKGRR